MTMKDERTWFEKDLDEIKDTFDFRLADLEYFVTEDIVGLMLEKGISKAELARRLGTSRAAVTMFLRDGSNLTLKRILKVADALEAKVTIKIGDKPAKSESCGPPTEIIMVRGVVQPSRAGRDFFLPKAGFTDEYLLSLDATG